MKNTSMRLIGLLLSMLSFLAAPAFAQQYTISNTTLNGAINISQTTLTLTSASASAGSSFGAPAAGQCLFVDGELMQILSMSSTTATVRRDTQGAAPHANAAVVWTAACNAFKKVPPPFLSSGNQICSAQPAPWIDTEGDTIWWCNTATNKWSGFTFRTFTFNSVPLAQ